MNFSEMDDSKKKLLIFAGIGAGVFLLLIIIVTVVALGNQGGEQTAEGTEEQAPQSDAGSSSDSGPRQGIPEIPEDDIEEKDEDDQASGEQERLSLTEQPIAKVGEETIYMSALIAEKKHYPYDDVDTPKVNKRLIQKIASDSAILQGALEDNIIRVDDSVYNSPDLDYEKRIVLIEEIKKRLKESTTRLKGSVVSIWFYNNYEIGPLGYEGSNEKAFEVISDLHQRVKNREITIEEAGSIIRNDETLEDLDRAYKTNALFTFNVEGEDTITLDEQFDEVIWAMDEGEVSDVVPITLYQLKEGEEMESLYMFAQVEEKKQGSIINFDTWFQEQISTYELSAY